MGKSVYISGKISGIEMRAKTLFREAETEIRQMGMIPVNPMTLPHNHDKSWESYMKEDIKALCDCDSIFMLTNWKESKGAMIEHDIAKKIGIGVFYQSKQE